MICSLYVALFRLLSSNSEQDRENQDKNHPAIPELIIDRKQTDVLIQSWKSTKVLRNNVRGN